MIFNADGDKVNLGNKFNNWPVFFIGSGPSLLNQNLDLLKQRGIVTFAINNVAAKTIRPTLWACADNPKSFHRSIWLDAGIIKFLSDDWLGHHFYMDESGEMSSFSARHCPNTYYYNINKKFDTRTFLNEKSFSFGREKGDRDDLGIVGGRSTMLVAIKLIIYLGFKYIYLLGCDFHMEHDDTEESKGKGKTYAFSQYKWRGGVATNNQCYDILNKRFDALNKQFLGEGVHIINCSSQSKLTSFPVRDYEESVEEALDLIRFPRHIETWGYYGGTKNKNRFGWD